MHQNELHTAVTPTGAAIAQRRRRTKRRRALRGLAALVVTALAPFVTAQADDTTPTDPPVVAVHYQDLLSHEPATVDLFIPPPQVQWTEFTYQAQSCLSGGSLLTGPPDSVIVVRFEVAEVGTCSTRVDLHFSDGTTSWAAAALVVVNRLEALPGIIDLQPSFSSERIHLPGSQVGDAPADLILLGITNPHPAPMTLLGFGNDAAFAELVGQAFRYEPAKFFGRYTDLVTSAEPFEATALEPGATANFALVIDARQRLPTARGTISFRPVALLEIEGQRYTLGFPRISSAWGTELP